MSNITSKRITECQISGSKNLESFLFLGYVPPVNQMKDIGSGLEEQLMFPLELLYCPDSHLVQISCEVDPNILFPPEYPYTSGTTRVLRENFANLYTQTKKLLGINTESFVIDFGSNDGTLLSNFNDAGCKVLGIEPSDKAQLANSRGIRSIQAFFSEETANKVKEEYGEADLITAANVFAHIPDVHQIVRGVKLLLKANGVFISENHYLLGLIETLQYDTVYHEHLRYYSIHSLKYLFEQNDMEIFRVEAIPSHGGSVRVYSARKGEREIDSSVGEYLAREKEAGLLDIETYKDFSKKVMQTKLELYALLKDIKAKGARIYGIGAPSRASTLISYTGIDNRVLDCVMEIKGSYKIGKYMPGTLIPVIDETKLYEDQPEYAMFLSWHIADELAENLRKNGFKGKFIVPLPTPRIIE